jgi:hypothetical protein
MCGRSAEYANKPHNAAKASTFLLECRIPRHAAPFRTTPHLCRATPHLCHSCCGRFRTKELGQAALLHKTIHLCGNSVFCVALMQQDIFNLWISFRTISADCPWKFCGNSMGKAEAA